MKVRIEMGHFWITFENGYTLSVFNGYGSHTENNFALEKQQDIVKHHKIFEGWDSNLVEIAITRNGFFITYYILKNCDDVKGHVNRKELKEIIKKIKRYKK